MADQTGFHAEVDTNEPGTASKNPADVIFRSTAPENVEDAPGGAHGGAHGGNNSADYDSHSQLSNARAQAGGRGGGYENPNAGGRGGGYGNPNAGGWEEE